MQIAACMANATFQVKLRGWQKNMADGWYPQIALPKKVLYILVHKVTPKTVRYQQYKTCKSIALQILARFPGFYLNIACTKHKAAKNNDIYWNH